MAVLESSAVERVYLPSTESLAPDDPNKKWVDIIQGKLVAGDIIGIDPTKDSDIEASFKLLANRIKEWCFTDVDGAPVPITLDNIKRLDVEDFGFLSQLITSDMGSTLETTEKKT